MNLNIFALGASKGENWGPLRDTSGKKLIIRTNFSPSYLPVLDTSKATLGARLRHLRKRLGWERVTSFATIARLGHNTIARIERDEVKDIQPWIFGRLLAPLVKKSRVLFPDLTGDIYDYLIPPTSFGGQLRNYRLRHGLKQNELAKKLGVARFTVQRYESDRFAPKQDVCRHIREILGFNGVPVDKSPIKCRSYKSV